MTAIDLTTSQYQSIEAVDASTLKAAKNVTDTSTMGVNVMASTSGTRFTGSSFADTFNCNTGKDYIVYKTNQGADTIDSFGVDDVIKLNGLTNVEKGSIASQIAAVNNGTADTITFSAGGGSLKFTNISAKLTYDSTTQTIKGTTTTAG